MPRTKPKQLRLVTPKAKVAEYNLRIDRLPACYRHADLTVSQMRGDALGKAIPDGYAVVFAKGEAVNSGDLVAFYDSGDLLVRYVYFGPSGWARFQATDRHEYPDIILKPSEFEIIGPVIHSEPYVPG